MAISEQQLVIVRQINGKYKVHQILPVIKTAYNWIPSLSSSWMWDQTICEPSNLLSTSDRQRTSHGAEIYCSTLVFKEVVRPMHCAVLLIQWRPKSRRWGTGCLQSGFKRLICCFRKFRNVRIFRISFHLDNIKPHFENSVHACIQAGPVTLLIYLRLAKLTLDQKCIKREKNLEYFEMQELYLHDICTSSVSSSTSDGGLKFINRLI